MAGPGILVHASAGLDQLIELLIFAVARGQAHGLADVLHGRHPVALPIVGLSAEIVPAVIPIPLRDGGEHMERLGIGAGLNIVEGWDRDTDDLDASGCCQDTTMMISSR